MRGPTHHGAPWRGDPQARAERPSAVAGGIGRAQSAKSQYTPAMTKSGDMAVSRDFWAGKHPFPGGYGQ
jgi:hypothetical protein